MKVTCGKFNVNNRSSADFFVSAQYEKFTEIPKLNLPQCVCTETVLNVGEKEEK